MCKVCVDRPSKEKELKNIEKGSVEFTYSYPLPAREENDLFLFFKTFNGYGESLIDYNYKVNKISIGLSISR